MRHKWDVGNMVEDMRKVVDDAKSMQPSLIVVPTEREVRVFDRNFKSDLDGQSVFCCCFADYYDGSWMMLKPRPKHIFAFRKDDIWKNISADAIVEYGTSISNKSKKEERKNEEA